MDVKGSRTAIYARVSTDEQVRYGESLADQTEMLKKWAIEHECILIREPFVDAGYSAHKSYKTRPALRELLEEVKQDKIDLIIFTKLDRWGRRASDYYRMQDILEAHHVAWAAVLEDYDTTTSDGRLRVGIMLSINQHEAERTSDRIKFTFEQKRARGEIVSGNMPRGYRLQEGKPVIDEEKKEAIDAFFRTYLSGKGLNAALDAAAARGEMINISSASYMLRNALAYTGLIQGIRCDAYITDDEAKQIELSRKARRAPTGHIYLFSGIIYCGECGGRLGSHKHNYKNKSGTGTQIYYNCTRHNSKKGCSNKVNIYERDIEDFIIADLSRKIEEGATIAELSQKRRSTGSNRNAQKDIDKLNRRKSRLWEAYLSEVITLEAYKKELEAIDAQLKTFEIEEEKPEEKTAEEIRSMMPEGWKEMYNDLDTAHKAMFLKNIIKTVRIYADRSIGYELEI